MKRFIKLASKFPNLFEIISRLICVITYSFPFLELYLFFNPLMRSYRISPGWLEAAAISFRANPALSMGVFTVILTVTSIRSIKINYYSRYNLMQALILLFFSNFLDTLDYLFPYVVRGQGSMMAPFFYFICFAQMLLVIYCAIYAIIGKIPNIPLMTEAIKIQISEYGNENKD